MKSVMRYMYGNFKKCTRLYKWKKESNAICVGLDNKIPIDEQINIDNNEKILIVVPHPDDELIGCYSIINKYSENVILFYSGMTGDDVSEKNRIIRKNEFIQYCSELNVQSVITEQYLRENVENIIFNHNIKYVFVPSVIDWHGEHRALFLDVVNLLKNCDKTEIYCYQVSVPIAQEFITHYSGMSKKENAHKWDTFKRVYISQKFMPVARFRISERVYKKSENRVYAEVFMKLDNRMFCALLKSNYNDLNLLKTSINNLIQIRREAEQKYKSIFNIEDL